MTIDEAFAQLKTAFPIEAQWQGLHFRYAARDDALLIEQRRAGRYFYWLLVDGHFKLVHASLESKLRKLRTIGDSFRPSKEYDH